MTDELRLMRFRLGRALIHLGLAVFPSGRAKDELSDLLWRWGDQVRLAVAVRDHLKDKSE